MQWAEVIDNPYFKDLPFKIELNRFGQVLMSPASNQHGNLEYRVGRALERGCPEGEIIIECSIQTTDGVKVADVAWASTDFIQQYGYSTPYTQAPEICVEIISPSNTDEEMQLKIALYLAQGAREIWLVDTKASIRFFNVSGEQHKSSWLSNVKL
ncbi:MAG: Uma2 family endonuclease [Methylococcaceae bacterium]|nr:Uma2 family endonuclease [Methylococcaceae bacterium]